MDSSRSYSTSPTLLRLVGRDPSDQVAWEAFVARYGPKVYLWCRQRGLQAADAEDVSQDVLLRLARALKTFTYDPSRTFRGWLRVVTQHALSDFFAARRRACVGSGEGRVLEALGSVPAREELVASMEGEFDREVVAMACATARARVQPRTWEAFRLTACERRPAEEVATGLAMTVAAVFKAKSRILGFIREEVGRLNGEP